LRKSDESWVSNFQEHFPRPPTMLLPYFTAAATATVAWAKNRVSCQHLCAFPVAIVTGPGPTRTQRWGQQKSRGFGSDRESWRCRTDFGPRKISDFMHLAGQVHTQTFNFISVVCAKPKAEVGPGCPSGILWSLATWPNYIDHWRLKAGVECNFVPQLCLAINFDSRVH